MTGATYAVDIAMGVPGRPQRSVTEVAELVERFGRMLPEGTVLRGLRLPEREGVVEVQVDIAATGAADALRKVMRAVELVIVTAAGPDAIGQLHHACIIQRPGSEFDQLAG